VRGFGAKALSGLWTMRGSSYMPGTLVLTGSPSPDVLKMMYCALSAAPHGAGTSASAFCGFKRNEMGSPLAIERSPTPPAPKSIERSALRREIMACSSESNGDRRWRKARHDEGRLKGLRRCRARLFHRGGEMRLQE